MIYAIFFLISLMTTMNIAKY